MALTPSSMRDIRSLKNVGLCAPAPFRHAHAVLPHTYMAVLCSRSRHSWRRSGTRDRGNGVGTGVANEVAAQAGAHHESGNSTTMMLTSNCAYLFFRYGGRSSVALGTSSRSHESSASFTSSR